MDQENIPGPNQFDKLFKKKIQDADYVSGKMFGHYKIEKELGRGGMGIVYKAYDTKLNNYVALKVVIREDETESIQRFLREASATAQLNHPNIVRFYEASESPKPYFTMEYIEGRTLAELIKEKKVKPLYLVDMMIELCDALYLAHKNNILHRDIKPSNIMITRQGKAKIMDFGLAKLTKENMEQLSLSGEPLGTLLYMAPEQIEGKASEKSDIYSIGATIYEAITFRPPFQSDNQMNLMFQIANGFSIPPRELNPDISPYLEAICLKCINKKPGKRYTDFKQLSRELKNFKAHRPLIAKKYNIWDSLTNFARRHKTLYVGFVIFFLTLTVTTALYISFTQKHNQRLQQEKRKAQKAEKIAKKRAQDLSEFNKAMIRSLEYLSETKHNEIYYDRQFREPLELIFEQSIKLATGTGYERLRSFVLMHSNKQKNKQQALKDITKHIQENPTSTAYINRANLFYDQRKYSEAEQDYTKAISLNPRNIQAYISRGIFYDNHRRYSEAEKDYTKAISLDPKYANAYISRGSLYYDQKRYSEAERDFNKVIILNPDDIETYYKRNNVYQKQRKYSKAERDLNKIISLNPKLAVSYYHRGIFYYDQKRYGEAERDYNKVVALNPNFAEVYNSLAILYSMRKEYKKAEKYFNNAIAIDPKLANVYLNRGALFANQKRYKEAERDFNKVIALNPGLAEAYQNRGLLYKKQKRYRKAIQDWQQAISLGKSKQKLQLWINRAENILNKSK